MAFDVAQSLQFAGVLAYPLDEVLIYGTSLCIVVPFLLEMLAFHHATERDRQFWTHAAVLFTMLYAVFVTANYVVQLATVIPANIAGTATSIAFAAHAAVTPLIAVVYFYPTFSESLLLIGAPWAITAPLFMALLAMRLGRQGAAAQDD